MQKLTQKIKATAYLRRTTDKMKSENQRDFIFVRHGRSVANSEFIIQGRIDSPLSGEGRKQALKTAKLLKEKYSDTIEAIYTSPLSRARETAEIIANELNFPGNIVVVEDLTEASFGKWEGKTPEEVIKEDPELFYLWLKNPSEVIPPGGEGFDRVRERISRAMESIRKKESGKNVVVVGHAASFSAYLNFLYSFPPESLWKIALGNASISIFDNQTYETPPTLKTLNSYFHLESLDVFLKDQYFSKSGSSKNDFLEGNNRK